MRVSPPEVATLSPMRSQRRVWTRGVVRVAWPMPSGAQPAGVMAGTVIDTFSRYAPAVEARFNFRGADVVEVLERVGREVGFPAAIRVIDPISRSAKPFCQGDAGAVGLSRMTMARIRRVTMAP